MNRITRRGALGGVLGGAMAVAVGGAAPAFAARVSAIPLRPMRLVRRIERHLRGGAIIEVTRDWQISFSRQAGGIAITGEQIAAKVNAPEALAALARIEETRSTDEMFPILLSSDGSIMTTGDYTQRSDLVAAVQEAEAAISKRAVSAPAKGQLRHYLAQLQRSGGALLDRMPRDLFFPVNPPSRAVRPVSLPDGLMGEFEVTYTAHTAPGHDWLESAVREVVTRIGDSERRSTEVWSLTEI